MSAWPPEYFALNSTNIYEDHLTIMYRDTKDFVKTASDLENASHTLYALAKKLDNIATQILNEALNALVTKAASRSTDERR